MTVVGKRIYTTEEAEPWEIEDALGPGDYAKCTKYDFWLLRAPNGDMCSVRGPKMTVTEHKNGTITVGPASIQFPAGGWHGYLHSGVWSQA